MTWNSQAKIDARFENETVWLTKNTLAELFQTTRQNRGCFNVDRYFDLKWNLR